MASLDSQIIYYGGGEKAESYTRLLKKRGITLACYADRDKAKQGKTKCGKEILSGKNKINKLNFNFEGNCNFNCIYCARKGRDSKMSKQTIPER